MIDLNKIKKTQQMAYQIILNSKLNNRLAHSYILHSQTVSNLREFAQFLLLSFICTNRSEVICKNCKNCIDYISGTFLDLVVIDNNDLIKKDSILEAIRKMNQKALNADGKKVLLIYNIDKANKFASNSLLKFLEEPHNNTLIIFTTYKYESLNSTIRSRTQSIKLKGKKWEHLAQIIQNHNIPVEHANIMASFYMNEEQILKNYEDDSKIINDVISDLEHWTDNNWLPINLWNNFSNEHLELNIHILKLFFLDAWKDSNLIFSNHKDLYKKVQNKKVDYQKIIDALVLFQKQIFANVGIEIAKANLFLTIGDACA